MWKHLCCVIELFRLRIPKPTSFPTRCSVWEASGTNQSKPGKTGSNGFRKHAISKIWIGSTESHWSSSGQTYLGFTTLGILAEIQKMMTESKCEPEQFKGRIIFMSMKNDIVGRERGSKENCFASSVKHTEHARRFPQGRWSFLGPGCDKKWCGTHTHKPDGEWDQTAEGMMLNFAESGRPVFRATSALERGELRSTEKGKKSFHFNGRDETVELILRTVISQRLILESRKHPKREGGFVETRRLDQSWM